MVQCELEVERRSPVADFVRPWAAELLIFWAVHAFTEIL